MKSISTIHRPTLANRSFGQTLETMQAATRLASFAELTNCNPLELSADGGKSLDLLSVLNAMRARGYSVSTPKKPQTQLIRGFTTWLVSVSVQKVGVTLAFNIPEDVS
ncbi:hypothetical protein AAKU55_005600 [Oxalobacteraceae bacterium GrIS 1.11]